MFHNKGARLVVCLFALCGAAAQAQAEDFEKFARQAAQYSQQGKYAEAEAAWRSAIRELEKDGRINARLVIALNGLGSSLHAQSRNLEAEQAFLRAREACEKGGMAGTSAMAVTLNSLGSIYHSQARFAEAEKSYLDSLAVWKTPGDSNASIALTLNNLCALYADMGGHKQGEGYCLRALDERRRLSGPDHPETAKTMVNLAALYTFQGRIPKAERLYAQALELQRKALDPGDDNLALTRNNIAHLYHLQGKFIEAERLYRQALASREKRFGPNHPLVAA